MPGRDTIQKLLDFLNEVYFWFEENIFRHFIAILKWVADLIIKILEFLIETVKWLISYL